MSVIEPTKEEVTEELQLLKKTEEEDPQFDNEIKEEQGQERNEDDQKKMQNGGGGSTIDIDHDAQEMVISSLRTQIQDLFSQVNQLNNKLVGSYDRVSDLEDSLHVTTTNLQLSNQKVNQLELEKSQHLSQLTSGSLVEKSHVTAELTRLMERATEEAAQRGQAESAKDKIERELEELSASLFGEANGMVQEARVARSLSERKVEDAEGRLREAEEAVRMMQSQMQALMQEKENVERNPGALTVNSTADLVEGGERLMKSHLAYHEYLAFLAHLRHIHISNPNGVPPAMAALLQLPFLSRLLSEDSEPTLRLDLAPSLNWLSRRSVLSAIHTGQLSVEPISAGTLFTLSMESPLITIAGVSPSSLNVMTAKLEDLEINIPCALCGSSIFPIDTTSTSNNSYSTTSTHQSSLAPHFSSVHITMPSTATWSAAAGSFFRKPIPLTRTLSSTPAVNGLSINGTSTAPDTTPPSPTTTTQNVHLMAKSKHLSSNAHITPQTQIHIFRLASLPSSTSSALSSFGLPLSKSSSPSSPPPSTSGSASSSRPASSASLTSSTTVASSQPTTYYPLCTSGWCLARLRATCTLWSFIRTGIVEKVWDEEVILPTPPASPSRTSSSGSTVTATSTSRPIVESSNSSIEPLRQGKAPPPLPPRRRGLWGIASALGEKAASWGEGGSKEKRESKGSTTPLSNENIMPGGGRYVPLIKASSLDDKLNSSSAETESAPSSSSTPPPPPPPPLPKRSVNRSLSHRGENNSSPSPTPKAQVESSTSTSPTDAIHTSSSPIRKSPPPAKGVAHIRNSSLSHAANIPLPESRAGTPSLPAIDLKINGTNVDRTPTPSRTSSPALPVMGGTPSSKPPVPRRAAARNRGGVVVVGSSLDDEKVKKEDPLGHTTGTVGSADSKVEMMMAAKEEVSVLESEGKEEGEKTARLASYAVAGGVPVEEEKVDVVRMPDKKMDDLIISESESHGMNNVIKAVEGEKKDSRLEELPTEKTSLPDAHHQENHPTEPSDTDPNDETSRIDQTQYVGTSTWEEKMWRELVRIRKEMFYARMGVTNS